MSPGRASSALTTLRPLLPCSAFCTQVATAAQPLPGILCPACSSDQVTNDAHHGFPGATSAALRYSSTCAPRFAPPISCTPRWVSAIFSAAAPSELPPPPAGASATASAAAPAAAPAAGRRLGGGLRGGRAGAELREQPVGVVEAQLVAAAELLGRALDVGDPLAELVRVGDGLAVGDALLLDRFGLVEEPLDLQLGLVGVAGVGAVVPDAHAHLEEAHGVAVAAVHVRQPGLDQRRHHGQLARQAARFGLLGHPRGDLLLRGAVPRVGVRDSGEVARGHHGVRGGGRARLHRGGRARLLGRHRLEEPLRVVRRARRSVAGLGLGRALDRQEAARLVRVRRLGDRRRRSGGRRGRVRGDRGRCRGGRCRRGAGGGHVGGRLEVRADRIVEADVDVVLVRGVGEERRARDRERAADLGRPDRRVELGEMRGHLARVEVRGADGHAIDRRDVDAAAEVVIGHRAAGRELRVVGLGRRDRELVVLAELRQHRRRSAGRSALPSCP